MKNKSLPFYSSSRTVWRHPSSGECKPKPQSEKWSKAGGLVLPDFKTRCKATAIKTVCYWHKDRYTGRWDRTEKPEMNPDTPTNWRSSRVPRPPVGKEQTFRTRCWNEECPRAGGGWPHALLHMQTLAWNAPSPQRVQQPKHRKQTQVNPPDLGFGSEFLDLMPKTWPKTGKTRQVSLRSFLGFQPSIWDPFPLACSVQFSHSVVSDSLRPHGLGHARFPVRHQLPELAQTHVHRVSDAIQASHPLSFPSPSAFNLAQHQGLFQCVSSSHQVAKALEFQLQQQSFPWMLRTDFL